MKFPLLILALGSLPAFAQECNVIGIINKLADTEMMTVKTPRGLFTVYSDERTETMKDKASRGLSLLRVGDEVSVYCDAGSGKRSAIKIWATVVTFAATIHYINGDDIEVLTSANSDSHREERKIVHLYPDTALSTHRNNLVEDQDIRVVGLDVGNGAVDAARIALYNTDLPVRQ
jgi:ABC-type glutathione transport system ATPase component